MDNITLTEYCSKIRAQWLIKNINKVNIRIQSDEHYDIMSVINKYLKKIINSVDGNIKVTYNYGKGRTDGRLYALSHLQGIAREYRHTLCCNDYYDIDIINCHPTLLYQYCKQQNINYKYLYKYILYRNKYINEITDVNYEIVKQDILKILNGGKLPPYMIKNKFFSDLHDEITLIHSKIYELHKTNIELIKTVSKVKNSKYNFNGKLTSHILQQIENKVLMSMYDFFIKNGFEVNVLIFDGLMIRNNKPLTDEHLTQCSLYVKKITNYDIKLCNKPMNNGYNITNDELKLYNNDEIIIEDDKQATDIILNILNNKIMKCNNNIYISKNTNVYEIDDDINIRKTTEHLGQLISNMNIKKKVGDEKIKPYSKTTSGLNSLITMTKYNLPVNNEFVNILWHSNLRKICFLNGYYDFNERIFKQYDNKTLTTIFINKDFPNRIQEDIDFVYNKILNPILRNEQQRNHFLYWIARGMAGHYEDKTWALGLGLRNSGKSILTKLLKNTFENYINYFNAEEMTCSKMSTGDVAKRFGWLSCMEYSRLNISHEFSVNDDNNKKKTIDGNVIKKIQSCGIDSIQVRQLYKNKVDMKLQGRMLLFMNEMPQINPVDCLEGSCTYMFNSMFVDEITEKQQKVNDNNDEYYYFLKDNNINELITTDKIKNAFIHIILDNYDNKLLPKPDIIINNNNEIHDTDNNLENIINDLFNITLNNDDKIQATTLMTVMKERAPLVHRSAFLQKLMSLGITKCKKNLVYYCGLRIIQQQ